MDWFGYKSLDEWQAGETYDCVADYDREMAKATRDRLIETGCPQRNEIDMVHRDGKIRTVVWRDMPIADGSGKLTRMRCVGHPLKRRKSKLRG